MIKKKRKPKCFSMCSQNMQPWPQANWGHLNRDQPRFGLPGSFSGKESACQCKRPGFDPWVRKIPWRRKWQPTPVLLPGKSRGQRSLVDYISWGRERVEHDLATKQQTPFWKCLCACLLWDSCWLTVIEGPALWETSRSIQSLSQAGVIRHLLMQLAYGWHRQDWVRKG